MTARNRPLLAWTSPHDSWKEPMSPYDYLASVWRTGAPPRYRAVPTASAKPTGPDES